MRGMTGKRRGSRPADPGRYKAPPSGRPKEPLLCRHCVVVGAKLLNSHRDGASALRAVNEYWNTMSCQLADRQDGAIEPRDVGDSNEARPRRDLRLDGRQDLDGGTLADCRDPKLGAGGD